MSVGGAGGTRLFLVFWPVDSLRLGGLSRVGHGCGSVGWVWVSDVGGLVGTGCRLLVQAGSWSR